MSVAFTTWPPVKRALCIDPALLESLTGPLPDVGFDWGAVEELRLEDGVWQPYAGGEILPGPALHVICAAIRTPFPPEPNDKT